MPSWLQAPKRLSPYRIPVITCGSAGTDLLARPVLASAKKETSKASCAGDLPKTAPQVCATPPPGCVLVSKPTIGCHCATVANTQSGLLLHGNDVPIYKSQPTHGRSSHSWGAKIQVDQQSVELQSIL
jgi:hypothetical protein